MRERSISVKQLQKFGIYLYEEEKSENTIKKYLRDVKAFFGWADGKHIDKPLVLEYKKSLCEAYAPRSVNSMLSSLNTFFGFINRHELKVKTLKIQRRLFADREKELTMAEYDRLLTAAKMQNKEQLYYLMQTIASTGLRISELRFVSVDAVKKGQAVINCKGKVRRIFLPKQLCGMLKAYISRENLRNGAVFVGKNGKPLDRTTIWRMLKSLCPSAGVSRIKVFPHNFRHLFARTYYSVQKDIIRLADILGHSSVNTTRIYTMENGDIHRKQIQSLGLLRC